jgi:hypothetical protein
MKEKIILKRINMIKIILLLWIIICIGEDENYGDALGDAR